MEKPRPLIDTTEFIREDTADAATTAAVKRALEAAAGARDQNEIDHATIRAMAADPEQVARITQDPIP